MTILKDDGTWEPAPSGYTTGDKEGWRNRMHTLCPNPVVGQIVQMYSMNGSCDYYKALDSNGYDTHWQRVTSKTQSGITQLEEFISCSIKEEKDFLDHTSPNPVLGEIIITIMDRRWCNGYENERIVFKYTDNGWKEMECGRYLNGIASPPITSEGNCNSEHEIPEEVNGIIFDDDLSSSIVNEKNKTEYSIYDDAMIWYADILNEVHFELGYDDEISKLIIAEGKNIPHPHRPEWAIDHAYMVGFGDWGEGYNNCRVISENCSQYDDIEHLEYGSEEYFEYTLTIEKKHIEQELREIGIKEKILEKYEAWKIWRNKSENEKPETHFELCSIEPRFNYNSDIQNVLQSTLKNMAIDRQIINENIEINHLKI